MPRTWRRWEVAQVWNEGGPGSAASCHAQRAKPAEIRCAPGLNSVPSELDLASIGGGTRAGWLQQLDPNPQNLTRGLTFFNDA